MARKVGKGMGSCRASGLGRKVGACFLLLLVYDIQVLPVLDSVRERPFNLKGGGYGFFLKKYSDSQCC